VEADLTGGTAGPVGGSAEGYRDLSLWWDGLPGPLTLRPPLPASTEADVAIVGGGLTGLWTAYYLTEADPDLRIVVLERDTVGFGASGRNGGWCSALFAADDEALDRAGGPGAAAAVRAAMEETVREVGRVTEREGIACGYAAGGTVNVARTPAQWQRTRAEVDRARRRGIGEADLELTRPPSGSAAPGSSGRPTHRTAPPSTRPAWSGAWPRSWRPGA
jgi:glycine/D-amino acid oxidase-like deaminating enzyme